MISSLFLGIFENAVLALMTCLSVDMDLNGEDAKWGPPTFHAKVAQMLEAGKNKVDDASDDEKKANTVS